MSEKSKDQHLLAPRERGWSPWSCCRALAARAAPCRRVDALVGELEGGDITAGDRAHIAGDLLATCPAITDRERSILEWQTGWMLFCETGGRSARGI